MKLAIPFKLHNSFNEKAQEFNLKFLATSSPQRMIQFLEEYKNYDINIQFEDIDFAIVKKFVTVKPNLKIRLMEVDHQTLYALQSMNVSYFIDASVGCAYDRTSLTYYVEILKVSDVYVADELFYDLDFVKRYCGTFHIQIRFIANRIPSVDKDAGKDIKSPIFSPRDYEILNQYLDTIEFDCGIPYKWNVFEVLYRYWIEKQDWAGDLQEINKDLDIEYYPRSIPARFVVKKLNCQKRCETADSSCKSCSLYYQTHLTMRQKGLGFVKT